MLDMLMNKQTIFLVVCTIRFATRIIVGGLLRRDTFANFDSLI